LSAFRTLLDEADAHYAGSGGDHQAAVFYNALARMADSEPLVERREEGRGRALMGLAHRLRQRGPAGLVGVSTLSTFFPPGGPWEAGLVRDAEVAMRQAVQRPTRRTELSQRVRTHTGRLTAVCAARRTGDLFLGFADGEVIRFDPRRGCARVCRMHRG